MADLKVMLVDSDVACRQGIAAALSKDYHIIEAGNGKDALRLFRKHSPQVVMIALEMPVMDGLRFLSKVHPKPDSPFEVIIIAEKDDPEKLVKVYDLGVAKILIKPILAEEAKRAVARSIEFKRMSNANRETKDIILGLSRQLEEKISGETADLRREVEEYSKSETKMHDQHIKLESLVRERAKNLEKEIEERKKFQLLLEKRDNLFKAVADSAHAMLRLTPLERATSVALKSLGKVIKADRAYICESRPDESSRDIYLDRLFVWERKVKAVKNKSNPFENHSLKKFAPRWRKMLSRGVPVMGKLNDFSRNIRNILGAAGIVEIMLIPIIMKNNFWGVVGFDACRGEVNWGESEAVLLRAEAANIGAAIVRARIEQEWRNLNEQLEKKVEMRTSALRKSESRLSMALESASAGIWDWDIATGKLFVSRTFCERFGYHQDEIKTYDAWKRIVHPEDRMAAEQTLKNYFNGEKMYIHEYRVHTKSGKWRWLTSRGKVVEIDLKSKAPVRMTGTVVDIDELKKTREEADLRFHQLLQTDKLASLGRLVAGVAHEINNPTNFITLNIPILREVWENVLPLLQKRYEREGDFAIGKFNYSLLRKHIDKLLEGVTHGAERIKNIVSELKDYARPDEETLKNDLRINRIVGNSLKLLQPELENIPDFMVSYGRKIPPVKGAQHRLEQVIMNLVRNSMEALTKRNGSIHISTRYVKSEKMVKVTVADNGTGMDTTTLTHITEPFFTTKRDSGGTGLGLAVSMNIVRLHKGTMDFISEPGHGTTAIIKLPAVNPG